MLSSIVSSGRTVPYVLRCNRGVSCIPNEKELTQEYMIFQEIAVGFPADCIKPGPNGTVFEGGIDDTYPREVAYDLFRGVCIEFTLYLRECQQELDKLALFLSNRIGQSRQSFEDPEFLIEFFNMSSVQNERLLDEYLDSLTAPKKKRRRDEVDDVTADEAAKEEMRLKIQSACLAALCKLRAYTEVIEKDTLDGSRQAYRFREVAMILRPACVLCEDFNDMLCRICKRNQREELESQVRHNLCRSNKAHTAL